MHYLSLRGATVGVFHPSTSININITLRVCITNVKHGGNVNLQSVTQGLSVEEGITLSAIYPVT